MTKLRPAERAEPRPGPVPEDAVARFVRGTAVWTIATLLVLDLLTVGLDSTLVALSGQSWRVVLATAIAGTALAPFVAIVVAPGAAVLELLCRRIEQSQRRRFWPLPIAVAAWLVGAVMTSTLLQPAKPLELVALTGFAALVVACALLARMRRGPPVALALAILAVYLELRLPIARDDWRDLLAIVAVAALLAGTARVRRRLAGIPRARLLAAVGVVLAMSIVLLKGLDRAPAAWRAAAVHHAHYEPRFARACRLAVDLDGDGFSAIAWGGDCDDANPRRNPRAHELPNGIDMNCNGTVLPPNPSDFERGLAPAAGDPNLAAGAVDLVLLVTIDAWRADSLRADVMPNATALAARGVTMSRMYSAGTATRVTLRLALRVGADEDSVASRLTLGGVSSEAVFAFQRYELRDLLLDGFAELRIPPNPGDRFGARQTTDLAIEQLRQPRGGPHFLWVHYYDAHQPLVEVTPGIAPGYLTELAYIDRELGRLFEAVPWARAMVVLTTDHGEAFDSRGLAYHAVTAKEVLMHVPAIMILPGLAPRVYDGLVSSRDLAPTVLGAFGRCEPGAERFGRSWLRLRSAPEAPLHEFVVSYSAEAVRGAAYVMPMAAIVEPRIKLVETFENTLVEVYDPTSDPLELDDRSTRDLVETARLRHRLALFRDIDGYL